MKINSKQFKTKNFKGVVSLLMGNTLSKAIVTLGGLVLANYYGPENYGIYNVFLSYMMILPVLSGLRLDNIMIMQRGSKEIRNLFSGIFIVSFVLTFLIVSLMCLLKLFKIIEFQFGFVEMILVGIGAILTSWNLTQNNLFTKYKLFKQISNSFVIASIFSVVFQAVFYIIGWVESGLIYGWLVGLIASFLYNARIAKARLSKLDFGLFKSSVLEHKRIVQYSYPSDAINSIANNIMPILVILYFSQAVVGIYAMALKMLATPLTLLSESVSRVYFQKAVNLKHHDSKTLFQLTQKVVLTNVAIIFCFVILMNTIGVYVLDLVLNDSWDSLSQYIWALSFWILCRSALTPIAAVIMVVNKNHYSLVFNLYLLLVNFIALYFGVQQNDFLYCVWIFSILSGIGYLILLTMVLIELKKHAKS